MKVIGIIAEYNPFHNGHKYQIDYARNILKADYIVIAMSGNFTQRGDIACFDKYTRAKMALLNGADIVFEIPAIFATSSAKEYANCGVKLLAATGLVDTILFGSEAGDTDLFLQAAQTIIEKSKSQEFNNFVSQKVTEGISYAKARSDYFKGIVSPKLLSNPNNILGLEYTMAIQENKLPIKIETIKREGGGYNESRLTGDFSSATAIRNSLENNGDCFALPDNVREIIKANTLIKQDDLSLLLHFLLDNQTDFSGYADISPDLSDRINKTKGQYTSISDYCTLFKTKNYTYSRINRMLTHILLEITKDSFEKAKANNYLNHLRLLGFSKNGSKLLSLIKKNASLPLFSAPNDYTSEVDLRASNIYKALLTEKTGLSYPNEFTRKFDLANL